MSAELPATVPTSFLQSLSYLIVGIDRHSNVASVLHLGRTGTGYFYAMEFVEGETLENLVKRSGRLDVKACAPNRGAGGCRVGCGGSKNRRTKIISAVRKTASVSKSGANAILAQIILDIPTS